MKKSRLLVKALRHDPDIIGIKLDSRGWSFVCDVLKALSITKSDLDKIVSNDNKGRFEYSDNHLKIRAAQGHSISNLEVYKDWIEYIPQSYLYHGTPDFAVDRIMKSTLISMTRTHVHLSKDIETAWNVGKRHGRPIILQIDAIKMYEDGYKFYESKNGVVLIDEVPSFYMMPLDRGQLISLGFSK